LPNLVVEQKATDFPEPPANQHFGITIAVNAIYEGGSGYIRIAVDEYEEEEKDGVITYKRTGNVVIYDVSA